MATVVNVRGHRIEVYTNDHCPAHVHVTKPGDGTVKVYLLAADVELGEYCGFSERQAIAAAELVDANLTACWAKWRQIHGTCNCPQKPKGT